MPKAFRHPYILLIGVLLLTFCKEEDTIVATPYELNTPFNFGFYDIPEDNPLTEEGVQLGRRLFYDKLLSKDQSISCASCHQQNLAFTDGKKLALGINGSQIPRNSMSIANLLWSNRFFWDGRAISLEDQALQPIENPAEMGLPIEEAVQRLRASSEYRALFFNTFGTHNLDKEHIAKALAQFQRTLISQDSRYDVFLTSGKGFTEQELHGLNLFFTHPDTKSGVRGANCFDCHRNILTDGFPSGFDGFRNNGLDNPNNLKDGLMKVTKSESDKGKMKVPTLRNIALTSPYMHDGRFETLEEVLSHYNEGVKESKTLDPLIRNATNIEGIHDEVKLGLTDQEIAAVIAFLKTLTDQKFIQNEDFSDPFENQD
ncbi:MAG: cytochrome c peroxidase [Ekhidna sp.]